MSNTPLVLTGLDRLAADDFEALRGRRVGAIVNPTAIDREFRHLADLLHASPQVSLNALFGPEHGVRGDAQDMIGVAHGRDPQTGVVVHSLYGESFASLMPSEEQLEGLDALVFDIQDVGSRYYTFAATLKYAMIKAAAVGLSVFVLDRPNPIDGKTIEGPLVSDGHESFVSAHPLPIRHGLTIGELARLFQADLHLDLDLQVVGLLGWDRAMQWRETGLPWVAPSPNMPTPETALVYPGGCLIEGTNLSEGRGTTRPFELVGAPWLNAQALARRLNEAGLPGVRFRACAFLPMFHKHRGEVCQGVQVHVTDARRFRPVASYTALIAEAREQAPRLFAWRTAAYEFVSSPIAIDLLYGSGSPRRALESGQAWRSLVDAWAVEESAFQRRAADVLGWNQAEAQS